MPAADSLPIFIIRLNRAEGDHESKETSIIELDDGKIYRKALYLMVKTNPMNQINHVLPMPTLSTL
jgi:hypothetical protein